MPPQLDHVVLLLPYAQLLELPAWVTENFTVSEGGKHADGKTENRLVLFQDGSYLELIAFVDDDPERRKGHWWDKPPGVIDFALTNLRDYDALASRLRDSGSGITYAPPQAGGRTKPDGTELQWRVTFPQGVQRGAAPFWCEDVTPRARRVPQAPTHPSGVVGVRGLVVEVAGAEVGRVREAMGSIVEGKRDGEGKFGMQAVKAVAGAEAPWVQVREGGEGLKLTLVLQGSGKRGVVRERVGDGMVEVVFE